MQYGDHHVSLVKEKLRRFSEELHDFENMSYSEAVYTSSIICSPQLSQRGLDSIIYTHFLITISVQISPHYNSNSNTTATSGHQFKLIIYRIRLNFRSNYFIKRLINDWNAFPTFVVNTDSVNGFKFLLC